MTLHSSRLQFMEEWLALRIVIALLLVCPLLRGASLSRGETTFALSSDRGLQLSVGGVPLIRGSSIQLFAPGWSEGYYSSSDAHHDVQQDDSSLVVRYVSARRVDFDVTQSVRMIDDQTAEIAIAGELRTDVPARIEWTIGYLDAFPYYNGGYSAAFESLTPIQPHQPSPTTEPTVLTNQERIVLDSPAARIDVRMSDAKLSLLDGRLAAQRGWARDKPSFWLGCLELNARAHQPFRYSVTVHVEPKAAADASALEQVSAILNHRDDIEIPQPGLRRIIPTPKEMHFGDGALHLKSSQRMITLAAADDAAKLLGRELADRYKVELQIAPSTGQPGTGTAPIAFVDDPQEKSEGYAVHISADAAQISASTPIGFRYAAQSLLQLINVDERGVCLPVVDIHDWPMLAFRGVHTFASKDTAFANEMVDRVLSRLKFNHLVVECEFSKWASDPAIWTDISVPIDALKEQIDHARQAGLEVIPLIQSLGHSQWMFRNGANRDLAEDPDAPAAYVARNPKTQEYIGKIQDEAIALAAPKYFHIGHDEVTLVGRYPNRPASKQIGTAKLFTDDVSMHHDRLIARHIRPMLWGDMLLARSDSSDGAAFAENAATAHAMRSALPRDAIICDWHYEPAAPKDYASLRTLTSEGFTTIACSWFDPENIYTLSKAAQLYGAWGLLQTTWAGYVIDRAALDREYRQFAAYVLAAEYSWNGDAPAPAQLGFRADEVLRELLDPPAVVAHARRGFTVNLRGQIDAPPQNVEVSSRVSSIAFDASTRSVIQLASRLLPGAHARSVKITLSEQAAELVFVHATAFACEPGETVGEYSIHYDDGSTEAVPLVYGATIRATTDLAACSGAALVCEGKTAAGIPCGARLMRWRNPHPQRTIRDVVFTSKHPYASPTLLALSGISEGPVDR